MATTRILRSKRSQPAPQVQPVVQAPVAPKPVQHGPHVHPNAPIKSGFSK